jgi:hypothetical protein
MEAYLSLKFVWLNELKLEVGKFSRARIGVQLYPNIFQVPSYGHEPSSK